MANKGWISIYRQIQDCWIWQDDVFSRGQAWIDLLLFANHHDKKIAFGNELITVEAGSFITSKRKLADRWQWSRTKVDNFLSLLEQDKMIVTKSDTKKTLVSIVNYEVYQQSSNEEKATKEPQESHKKATEKPQKSTNNNDNNINNDNNEINNNNIRAKSSDVNAFFDSIWELYPKKKGKGKVSDAKKRVLYDYGFDVIKRCIERYKSYIESAHMDEQFVMHGSTFFNSGYVDYLDDNYAGNSQSNNDSHYPDPNWPDELKRKWDMAQ